MEKYYVYWYKNTQDETEREVERVKNKRYSHIDVDQNQNKTQHEPWQNYKSLKKWCVTESKGNKATRK